MEKNDMKYDVIVIGGSYAGMAAALQLVRARRSVLVIDAGQRRNRFAAHSHGFLGYDGVDPTELATIARRQLEAYPSLTWLEGCVKKVSGAVDEFTVTTADKTSRQGRRILLAIGVNDSLPDIEGLPERWGRHVFHCPYCHGYELNQEAIGVIGAGPMSIHQAELLTDWGNVTLLVNDALELDDHVYSVLQNRKVKIETVRISKIQGDADVALEDGRLLRFSGLFTFPRTNPHGTLAEQIGCLFEETPSGMQVKVDSESKTSVLGIFACGDAARFPHTVSLAVGGGAMAGAQIHRSLVWPESIVLQLKH